MLWIILLIVILVEFVIICCLKVGKQADEVLETKRPELSEEEKEKQEKLRKNFDNLMKYDYNQALKSSKGE